MILELVHQIPLAVLAQIVELKLARHLHPLELVECLGRFDRAPTLAGIHHTPYDIVVVTWKQYILVEVRLL